MGLKWIWSLEDSENIIKMWLKRTIHKSLYYQLACKALSTDLQFDDTSLIFLSPNPAFLSKY